MKKILIVIFVAALFASCKGKSGWSSAEKKAFVESCVSNGSAMGDKAASYCDCMLEKVAQNTRIPTMHQNFLPAI